MSGRLPSRTGGSHSTAEMFFRLEVRRQDSGQAVRVCAELQRTMDFFALGAETSTQPSRAARESHPQILQPVGGHPGTDVPDVQADDPSPHISTSGPRLR